MNFAVVWDNLTYFMVGAWPHGPLGGAALTVLLSLASGLISAVLGLGLGVALSVTRGPAQAALRLGLGFFRAIPVLMLIFWIYFLLPVAFGVAPPGVATVVVALSLVGGAYLAHAVHAGVEGLPRGQWRAAAALGLSRGQALRRVILPQALPQMAPSFANQWVALIKDTSLAYVIGVSELSFVATQVNNREIAFPAEIFLFTAGVYFILCTALELAVSAAAGRARRYAP